MFEFGSHNALGPLAVAAAIATRGRPVDRSGGCEAFPLRLDLRRSLDLRRLDLPRADSRIDPDRVETAVGWGGQGDVVGAISSARLFRVSPRGRDEPWRGGGERRSPVNGGGEVQVSFLSLDRPIRPTSLPLRRRLV
jgi:hypothetical protein